MELGDFAVTYRVAGLARDLDQLIAMRRELRAQTLDALHSGGVEIVSPGFMNTRVIDAGARNVPSQPVRAVDDQQRLTPDDVVFDKAQQAESLENLKESIVEINQQIIECDERVKGLKDGKERRSIVFQKKKHQAQLARIESQISTAEVRMAQEA